MFCYFTGVLFSMKRIFDARPEASRIDTLEKKKERKSVWNRRHGAQCIAHHAKPNKPYFFFKKIVLMDVYTWKCQFFL